MAKGTLKQSREEFLDEIRGIIDYWSAIPNVDKENACKGVAFSIMCLLDGVCASKLYGYDVVDKETGQKITNYSSNLHNLHDDL